MAYPPDPGGNFATDVHRRVVCALPDPDEGFQTVDWILERVDRDDYLSIDRDELTETLSDLEADGDCKQNKAGEWVSTKAGHEALTGNNAWNGGRSYQHA